MPFLAPIALKRPSDAGFRGPKSVDLFTLRSTIYICPVFNSDAEGSEAASERDTYPGGSIKRWGPR